MASREAAMMEEQQHQPLSDTTDPPLYQRTPTKTQVIPSPKKRKGIPGFGSSTTEHKEEHDDPTLTGFGQPQSQQACRGNAGTGSSKSQFWEIETYQNSEIKSDNYSVTDKFS